VRHAHKTNTAIGSGRSSRVANYTDEAEEFSHTRFASSKNLAADQQARERQPLADA